MELGSADLTQHLLHNTTNTPRVLQCKHRSMVGTPGSSQGEGHEVTHAEVAARRSSSNSKGDDGDENQTNPKKSPVKRRKSLACIEQINCLNTVLLFGDDICLIERNSNE